MGVVTIIEGDYTVSEVDTVCEHIYALNDPTISGYGIIAVSEEVEETVSEETEEIEDTEITDTEETEESEEIEIEETEDTEESEETEIEETEETEESPTLFYTASDSGVNVTVIAPEGALPDGATLAVTLLDEDSDEYAEAAEAVGYEDSEDTGMAALDITFYDEFGIEVEPTLPVTVTVDITEIIPEGTTADTIEVTHITDTEVSTVEPLVETVTDTTDETAVVVFETESFSTFTISWSYYDQMEGNSSFTADVYVYDTNGDAINYTDLSTLSTVTFSSGDPVTLEDLCTVSGYTYSSAKVYCTYGNNGGNSDTVTGATTVTYTKNNGPGGTFKVDSSSYNNVQSVEIYLYFEASITDGLSIIDNIVSNGELAAKWVVNGEVITDYTGYTITWYKSSYTLSTDLSACTNNQNYSAVTSEDSLGDDPSTVNVAIDEGGLCYYYVEITDSSGTVVATSDVFHVEYVAELMNCSFEYPKETGGSTAVAMASVPFWSTTASDAAIEIGRYDGDNILYGTQYIYAGGSQTAAGDQFAELNANAQGALYQDVLTIDEEMLYWNFYHRARTANGGNTTGTQTDVMYVVIMSTEDAEKLLDGVAQTNQQTVLTAMITSVLNGQTNNSGTYTLVSGTYANTNTTVTATIWTLSTTTTQDGAWTLYSGSYEVPTNQYLTRFFFVSGESGTVGNLIDYATFSQDITYYIDYWVWDSKNEVYVQQSTIETGAEYPNTIVSASLLSTTYADYGVVGSVTGTASGGSNPTFDSTTSTSLKVTGDTMYLSVYLKSSGVTIVKNIAGIDDDDLDDLEASTVTVLITNTDTGDSEEYTINVGNTGNGSTYIELADGTYTISEVDYATSLINGTYTWSSVSVTGATASNSLVSYSFKVESSTSLTITFTNTYAEAVTGGPEMPQTGGRGTKLYTMVGLLLICSSGYLLYRTLKQQKRKCNRRWNI